MDEGTEPNFVCERVCTSDRLMRRMGGLAKVCASASSELAPLSWPLGSTYEETLSFISFSQDATPNTCVTVCGVSGGRLNGFCMLTQQFVIHPAVPCFASDSFVAIREDGPVLLPCLTKCFFFFLL